MAFFLILHSLLPSGERGKGKAYIELFVHIYVFLVPMKQNQLLLLIFKDFTRDYNANSASKAVSMTPRGALKILDNLFKDNSLVRKQLGKAKFYKINFNDEYTNKLIETILMKEAKDKAKRWLSEFESLFQNTESVIIFGSAIKNYEKAKDIDLVIITEKDNYKKVVKYIDEKNNILTKPIHPIIMTLNEFEKNLSAKNPAMLNAVKEGYVLSGYDQIVRVIKNVTGF